MTIEVWPHIISLADYFNSRFNHTGILQPVQDYGWANYVYTSDQYRRAHVEIVDHRDSHKMYILHCTIFPHVNDPSPIFGFDAVCGQHKITGAFHDYSSTGNIVNPMYKWFESLSNSYQWKKPRQLPEWAQSIFSDSIIAAGNVNTQDELDALCALASKSLDYYLANVGYNTSHGDYTAGQNKYCHHQRQNPHVVRSMVSMGIDQSLMLDFVDNMLFPFS